MGKKELLEEFRQKKRTVQHEDPGRVLSQHASGRLTARERIDRLLDAGSFLETGVTVGAGVVTGYGKVDGRTISIIADNFGAVNGRLGSIDRIKTERAIQIALHERHPLVWLIDEEMNEEEINPREASRRMWGYLADMARTVPAVAVITGPCYGATAFLARLCHLVVMVQGASMAVEGPAVVEQATGDRMSAEELGGSKLQAEAGEIDREASSDEEALALVRQFLSYLPANSSLMPPIVETQGGIQQGDDELLDIIPDAERRAYDMHEIIQKLVDDGKYFLLMPDFGKTLITCLARMGGRTVGIIASQPMYKAGAFEAEGADKEVYFVRMCDAFNIPLVFLTDQPGYAVGTVTERRRIVIRGTRAVETVVDATIPSVKVVLRKDFGLGMLSMRNAGMGSDTFSVSWPTAQISLMGPEAGVNVVYRRRLASAENPEELRQQLLTQWREQIKAISYASAGHAEVIDPRDTRALIIRYLEMARRRRQAVEGASGGGRRRGEKEAD